MHRSIRSSVSPLPADECTRQGRRQAWHAEEGMSLAEVLVAMVIAGVLFAAAAGALISFSQTSVNNERRVQATAMLNRLHEEMQALSWEDAFIYYEELTAGSFPPVDGLETDGDLDPPLFEGLDMAVRPGPDCDEGETECRVATVPVPYEIIMVDGHEYEIIRLVTWAPRDGTGPNDLKRFTTIVRWEVFGRTVEQRFDSERAPTPAELHGGNPSLQFLVVPSDVPLRFDDTNDVEIELTADFALLGHMNDAEVRFLVLDDADEPVEQVVALTRDGLSQRFKGTIAAGLFRFADGSQDFLRGLIETRVTPEGTWTLDTYLHHGATDSGHTLIDRSIQHPGDRWYWAALTYDGETMRHFIDGVEELSGEIEIGIMGPGKISLGVRQNLVYWYHGLLREIRFHPEVLDTDRLQKPS